MRVAICFSGMPRALDKGYEYLKHLVEKHNADIFVHTWLEDPYELAYRSNFPRNNRFIDPVYSEPTSSLEERSKNLVKIQLLYKPISMTVDKYHIYQKWYSNNEKWIYYYRHCSQLESIFLANELKKKYEIQNNFKYDVVIRCRFDLPLRQEFNFKEYDLDNYVYVRDVRAEWIGMPIPKGNKRLERHVNDMFAFSSSVNMDKWCNLYNYIKEAAEMIDDLELLKFYKETINGPDNHDLLWYYTHNRNTFIPIKEIPINWGKSSETLRD
jgi:hypothetical protein